jgi:hypothetical protein
VIAFGATKMCDDASLGVLPGALVQAGTGSPPSPPAPGTASSPAWSCGTAGGTVREPHPEREGHRLRNLPLKGFAQNQAWCEIVALNCKLLARTQLLALTGPPAAGSRNGSACASRRATPPTRRDSRAVRRNPAQKITHQPIPQASTRNIEANDYWILPTEDQERQIL